LRARISEPTPSSTSKRRCGVDAAHVGAAALAAAMAVATTAASACA
jgi:hypothetical protein